METRIAVQKESSENRGGWIEDGWYWKDNGQPVDQKQWRMAGTQWIMAVEDSTIPSPAEATFERIDNRNNEHNDQDVKQSKGIHASAPYQDKKSADLDGSHAIVVSFNSYDIPHGISFEEKSGHLSVILKDNILKVGGVVYELEEDKFPNKTYAAPALLVVIDDKQYIGKPIPFDGEKKAEEPKPSYTITAFRSKNKMHVYNHVKDDLYQWTFVDGTGAFQYHQLINNPEFEIYSAKNAAGLEVIVGKKYVLKKHIEVEGVVEVTRFDIYGKFMMGYYDGGFKSVDVDGFESEAKEPLLVTEDGIPIFDEKTRTWSVDADSDTDWQIGAYDAKVISPFQEHLKIFSTKEKAEAYVRMNKPILSLDDIHKEMFAYAPPVETRHEQELLHTIFTKLKEIVHSKLKS